MSDLIGTKLGQYEIKSVMGKGGMATVYRAFQPSMKRDVAIKVMSDLLSMDVEFVGRFEREAELFAVLQHPHILPVIDFGRQDSHVYIVMRLVEGGSLDARLRFGALPLPLSVKLLDQIGSALTFAHERGIVHRDLKPNNVLLDDSGNAYLTDFGIAKMLAGSSRLTSTNEVLGTPSYMAPEQWRGEAIDARTDIYSMGIMAYEMVTGRLPFEGDTSFTLMYKHINDHPPRPKDFVEDVSDAVEYVILKAVEKDAANRHQSAEAMGRAFRMAVEQGTMDTPLPLRAPASADMPTFVGGMGDEPTMATPLPTGHPYPAPTPVLTPIPQTAASRQGSSSAWIVGLVVLLILGAVGGYFLLTMGSEEDDPEVSETTSTPTLTETPADTDTPTPTDTPSIARASIVTQRSVLREGPGTDFPEILTLERGADYQVVAITEDGNWYRLLVGGNLGWVAAETVSITGNEGSFEVVQLPTPTDTPVPTDIPQPTDTPTEAPTDTPVPTNTPTDVATNTPAPTDTPQATATQQIVPTNTPAPQPLASGSTTGGSLLARQGQSWQFQAESGQVAHIEMVGLEPELDPYLTLLDPAGNVVAEDDDSGTGSGAQIRYQISTPGTYTVVARYFAFTDEGPYQITLTFVTVSQEQVINPGQPVTGTISQQAPEALYQFEGQAGARVTITMGATDANLDAYLSLLGPSGNVLIENDDYGTADVDLFFPSDAALVNFELPETGTYTIRATRYQGLGGDSGGGFELNLTVEPGE